MLLVSKRSKIKSFSFWKFQIFFSYRKTYNYAFSSRGVQKYQFIVSKSYKSSSVTEKAYNYAFSSWGVKKYNFLVSESFKSSSVTERRITMLLVPKGSKSISF